MTVTDNRSAPATDSLAMHSPLRGRLEQLVQRYRSRVPLAAALILIAAALWGYRGHNVSLLGPPLGVFGGQDLRATLRGAQEAAAGVSPYRHAIEFGRAVNFKEFMGWETAPYVYPPIVAVLSQPLSTLPAELAANVWLIISFAMLIGSAVAAVAAFSEAGLRNATGRLVLIGVLFVVFRPVQLDLQLAQVDIWVLFLLLLSFWLYRTGRTTTALTLALAMSIKPIVAPMLIFFVWRRQWRIILWTIVWGALLTAIGFFATSWNWLGDYVEVNRLWASGAMLAYPVNQSPTGVALRFFTDNAYSSPLLRLPWLGQLAPIAIGLRAAAGWWFGVRRTAAANVMTRDRIVYALTLTTVGLISPLTEDIHFVWMLMPLSAILLAGLDDLQHQRSVWPFIIGLGLALYLGYPELHKAIYYGWDSLALNNTLVEGRFTPLMGAYLYGLIALDVFIVIYLVTRHRRQLSAPRL